MGRSAAKLFGEPERPAWSRMIDEPRDLLLVNPHRARQGGRGILVHGDLFLGLVDPN